MIIVPNPLRNKMFYIYTSFLLFLCCLPLISLGATHDRPVVFWVGTAMGALATVLLPLERLLTGTEYEGEAE